MPVNRKKIFAFSGSTRTGSVNAQILRELSDMYAEKVDFMIFEGIDRLPHFNPDHTDENVPKTVIDFRTQIQNADGVLICTPEYVYSLPGSLKNAIEWTVSTVLFTNKPVALITASSSGQKAHEALNFLMSTIGAKIGASLLIEAPKTKISKEGKITDKTTLQKLEALMDTFICSLSESKQYL